MKDNFEPTCPLVIHWNGKILPEIFGEGSVDRLPVLVSGDGMDKLLDVPKMSSGTSENEANAVQKFLVECQLVEKVQAMCLDTTSVNTSRINGVCVGLEDRLGFGTSSVSLSPSCNRDHLVKGFHHLLCTFKFPRYPTFQTTQTLLECHHQAEFFRIPGETCSFHSLSDATMQS